VYWPVEAARAPLAHGVVDDLLYLNEAADFPDAEYHRHENEGQHERELNGRHAGALPASSCTCHSRISSPETTGLFRQAACRRRMLRTKSVCRTGTFAE
jgi:hypothetical protein